MDLLLYKDSNVIIPICTTNIKDFIEGEMTYWNLLSNFFITYRYSIEFFQKYK